MTKSLFKTGKMIWLNFFQPSGNAPNCYAGSQMRFRKMDWYSKNKLCRTSSASFPGILENTLENEWSIWAAAAIYAVADKSTQTNGIGRTSCWKSGTGIKEPKFENWYDFVCPQKSWTAWYKELNMQPRTCYLALILLCLFFLYGYFLQKVSWRKQTRIFPRLIPLAVCCHI